MNLKYWHNADGNLVIYLIFIIYLFPAASNSMIDNFVFSLGDRKNKSLAYLLWKKERDSAREDCWRLY